VKCEKIRIPNTLSC